MKRKALVVLGIAAAVTGTSSAFAGGGPENVLVVVNPESWASLTLANHYARTRHVPSCNVVFLPFKLDRNDHTTDVETFREKLLKPVLATIKERGLEQQIDCVAWSADFPTGIDLSLDLPAKQSFAVASINGLTFLHEEVLAKNVRGYTSMSANRYYRLEKDADGKPKSDVEPPLAFSSQQAWAADGKPAADGKKYLMSIVLGVTSNRGNSIREVTDCFARAASADQTAPKGTFYYSFNWNIRSTTRHWGFDPAIAKLELLGVKGEKDKNDLFPQKKEDVMGAMLGTQYPRQIESGSKTLPGAIVENLTSEGGIMSWSGGQTPISDFIRHGAAGSSGTVVEPMAIQAKFPTPYIFYHYAAGSSLAEAFYQSVRGPYQLLIVGDPLCQPYAKPPVVEVFASPKKPSTKLTYYAKLSKNSPEVVEYQWFVDGKLLTTTKVGELTPNTEIEGYREVAVEAVAKGALGIRGRAVQVVQVLRMGRKAEVAALEKEVIYGRPVTLAVACEGAKSIDVMHLGRKVAVLDGAKGNMSIETTALGMGPVRLQAVADVEGASVASAPIEVKVVPAAELPPVTVQIPQGQELLDGPVISSKDLAAPRVLEDMRRKQALSESKVQAGSAYTIEGYFDAAIDDLYQFQLWTDGPAAVSIDGIDIGKARAEKGWTFMPVALAKGGHRMLVTGTAGPARELTIRFGGQGTRDIGKHFHKFDPPENASFQFKHLGVKPPSTQPASEAPATQPR